jgi:hypothetical protein
MTNASVLSQPLWSLHPRHHTLLQWLSVVFVLAFCAYLLWVTGLLQIALASDRTYISATILLFLIAASGWCGIRAWWLGNQHRLLDELSTQ